MFNIKTVAQLKKEALENTIKPFQAALDAQIKENTKANDKSKAIKRELAEQEAKANVAQSEIEEARIYITKAKEFFA